MAFFQSEKLVSLTGADPWAAHYLLRASLRQTTWEKKDSRGQLWPSEQKQWNERHQFHEEEEYAWQTVCFMKNMEVGKTSEAMPRTNIQKSTFF